MVCFSVTTNYFENSKFIIDDLRFIIVLSVLSAFFWYTAGLIGKSGSESGFKMLMAASIVVGIIALDQTWIPYFLQIRQLSLDDIVRSFFPIAMFFFARKELSQLSVNTTDDKQ